MSIAQRIEGMRIAHEAKALRRFEEAGDEEERVQEEVEFICADPLLLSEVVLNGNWETSIEKVVTAAARLRVEQQREGDL